MSKDADTDFLSFLVVGESEVGDVHTRVGDVVRIKAKKKPRPPGPYAGCYAEISAVNEKVVEGWVMVPGPGGVKKAKVRLGHNAYETIGRVYTENEVQSFKDARQWAKDKANMSLRGNSWRE